MVIITYKRECDLPAESDVPCWMMAEETNGGRREWWRVQLWTGEVMDFATRQEAIDAYYA